MEIINPIPIDNLIESYLNRIKILEEQKEPNLIEIMGLWSRIEGLQWNKINSLIDKDILWNGRENSGL